jgi:hypothetical protein
MNAKLLPVKPSDASSRKKGAHPSGGLGTLALQMLSRWGAQVTAIARPPDFAACRQAGVAEVVDSSVKPFATLSRAFDATLNFAAWEDDLSLLGCLRGGALGHATTVHPLLGDFDELACTADSVRASQGPGQGIRRDEESRLDCQEMRRQPMEVK